MKHKTKNTKLFSSEAGQAMITAVVLLLFVSVAIMLGLGSTAIKDLRITANFVQSKQSYLAAESGVEDVTYRLKNAMAVSSPEVLILNGATATTTFTDVGSDKELISESDLESGVRKVRSLLTVTTSSSDSGFNYGVQVGAGGFILENSSSVKGNVYSNGPISGAGNFIYGDAISAGASGLVDGIHATGTVRAHSINDADIDKDAYYVTKTGTTVTGTSYPGSADQPTLPLPISDSQISDWEADALAGGTHTSPCPYLITTTVTLGPKKINCDVEISGSAVVTLTGTLWVVGNIEVKNTSRLQVSPSLPGKSVAIIADNAANRTTSSKVELENSSTFVGSGAGSYILFASQNNSAETGGSETAIDVNNTVSGALLLFSGHGETRLSNSINIKEVSGYRIRTKNTAQVIYESGVASALFTGGPSGSLDIKEWREIK